MSASEVEQWVNNDEGLYNWYRQWAKYNKGGLRKFVKEHRQELERMITAVMTGRKPAHYLAYDGLKRP